MKAPERSTSYIQLGEILWAHTRKALSHLPQRRRTLGVDLGCGSGHTTVHMALQFGFEMDGIDWDSALIECAKSFAEEKHVKANFQCRHVDKTLDYSLYDFIYGRLILNRLQEPEELLTQILNQAQKGTLIMFEDMDASSSAVEPRNESFLQLMKLYEQFEKREGRDPLIGSRLEDLLVKDDTRVLWKSSFTQRFCSNDTGKTLMADLFQTLASDLGDSPRQKRHRSFNGLKNSKDFQNLKNPSPVSMKSDRWQSKRSDEPSITLMEKKVHMILSPINSIA